MHIFVFLKYLKEGNRCCPWIPCVFFCLKVQRNVLDRTPKYFRTKKYKYLEWRTTKGKQKSVLLRKFSLTFLLIMQLKKIFIQSLHKFKNLKSETYTLCCLIVWGEGVIAGMSW